MSSSSQSDNPSRFAVKLDELPQTLELALAQGNGSLAQALHEGRHRPAVAVGSGGSAITAAYFVRCRDTLGAGLTQWMTPLAFTLGLQDLSQSDVWLFSAGGDNPDFKAALLAARSRGARHIHVLTRRTADLPEGTLWSNLSIHIVPVASEKDGFLATHSLLASLLALLLAFNQISNDPVSGFDDALRRGMAQALGPEGRDLACRQLEGFDENNVLVVLADPQLEPVSILIETSLWEASLCAVQLVDFRNFAHGRHSWLHHHQAKTFLLALFGHDTRALWQRTSEIIGPDTRRLELDLGNCGRFQNFVGIMKGLVLIEALGEVMGIDPGKPGIAEFGRTLYEDASLTQQADRLDHALRQKRSALLRRDNPESADLCYYAAQQQRLECLATARIGGIVLDYDGTLVSTQERRLPPSQEIVEELVRLHREGLKIAIASGRGGSAGKVLRDLLPPDTQARVLVGYYNGGYIRSLDVDIKVAPPEDHPGILETVLWLQRHDELFVKPFDGEHSHVQISIQTNNLAEPSKFARALAACPSVERGDIRIRQSGHSFDIIPATTSKCNVVERITETLAPELMVLRVGDQGGCLGNDHEMLSHPYGISVLDVCGRDEGCWSLFGTRITGPAALLRLLKALQSDGNGAVKLDLASLGLDAWDG